MDIEIGTIVWHSLKREKGLGEVVHIYENGNCKVIFKDSVFDGVPGSRFIKASNEDIKKWEKETQDRINSEIEEQEKLARQELISIVEADLMALLDTNSYAEADELANKMRFPLDDYLALKACALQTYFFKKNGNGICLSDEQAKAVALTGSDVLVKARAGSGKTTTLLYKVLFLIEQYKISPDEILVLAFNRKAADNFGSKINALYDCGFRNAMTFHRLAHSILKQKRKIKLVSDDPERYAKKELSKKIEYLIDELWQAKELDESFVSIFRDAILQYAVVPCDMSQEQYLGMRRRIKKVTLNGDYVKSYGEKVIGDYLFEHGIAYEYERSVAEGARSIRPDFSILKSYRDRVIIEYWGISFKNPSIGVPDDWTKSRDDYLEEMKFKKEWYQANGFLLIELSYDDASKGRASLENKLRIALSNCGINNERLHEEIILERVYRNHVKKFTTLCVQFIQKAQKNLLTPIDVLEKLEQLIRTSSPMLGCRSKEFLKCGVKVFQKYQKLLFDNKQIDFDMLMVEATNVVRNNYGDCLFGSDKYDRPFSSINSLKYIFIDEFQDFSQLFYGLITAIKEQNKSVKIVCVGDDWQAINRFAGADLTYIENFGKWFSGGIVLDLLTNRRSAKKIVRFGNYIMQNHGKQSISLPDKIDGEVSCHIPPRCDCISLQRDLNCQQIKQTVANHLSICSSLIKRHPKESIAILYRNNSMYGVELSEFHELLLKYSELKYGPDKTLRRRIAVANIHQFKGEERDVVIIMDVNDATYPFISEYYDLYNTFFGESITTMIEDERRLFYVGVTRAKSTLYLCRTEPVSRFLPGFENRSNLSSNDMMSA